MSTQTTQRFEGRTIEEALSAAVSSFGEELDIVDAQRVRRGGVMGFFTQERFEVTAARRLEEARFDAVLRALVDRVDDAESETFEGDGWTGSDFVLPAPDLDASDGPARAVVIEAAREEAGQAHVPADLADALGELFGEADELDEAPLVAIVDDHTAGAPVVPAHREVAGDELHHGAGEPRWGRRSLHRLGVPPAIIDALPRENPASDLEWVSALARAIETAMPQDLAAVTRVELTAHGVDAVIDLLRGATAGLRPTSIVVDGKAVAATPLELALAVRACLRDAA